MTQQVTLDPGLQPVWADGSTACSKEKTEQLEAKVQEVSRKHFDEFSAPDPVVYAILTAEAAGVSRNGVDIAAEFVPSASHAAVGLGWVAGPSYLVAGVVMSVVGCMLFPKCWDDFQNAREGDSYEEKWRSGLNLLDKFLLSSIGAVLCVIGSFTIAALSRAAFAASAAAVIAVASIVLAALLTLRGVEMMIRGGYGLRKASHFQKEFYEKAESKDLFDWLKQEKLKDSAALKNRIGQEAFDALSLEGFDQEKLKKLVEKGVYEEKLKQKLFLSIGAVMFAGGVLSLVALALTHGVAAPAIGLALGVAGSSFSLLTEALWMPYDNPNWFKKLAAWGYKKYEAEFRLSESEAFDGGGSIL